MTRVSKARDCLDTLLTLAGVDCSSGGTKQRVPFNKQGQGQIRKSRAGIKEAKGEGGKRSRGGVGKCAVEVFVRE